jgi:hypothetical protein
LARFFPYHGSFFESCGQAREAMEAVEAVNADVADVAAAAGETRAAATRVVTTAEVHAATFLLRILGTVHLRGVSPTEA